MDVGMFMAVIDFKQMQLYLLRRHYRHIFELVELSHLSVLRRSDNCKNYLLTIVSMDIVFCVLCSPLNPNK